MTGEHETNEPVSVQDILKERFGEIGFITRPMGLLAIVPPWLFREVAAFCHSDDRLAFDFLNNYAAVDRPPSSMEVYAQLYSYRHKHKLTLRLTVDRDLCELHSISSIWPAANWYEREMYDLFGITFLGHPDLRRLFMPDYWVGHPLRKDYQDSRIVPLPEVLSE